MNFLNLKYRLQEPLARQIKSLDDENTTHIHRQIILEKKVLKNIYRQNYLKFQSILDDCPDGAVLEIGSGCGLINEFMSGVISSEITFLPWVDIVCDATSLPFQDQSLSCIFLNGVFHHIPDVQRFLEESDRCLKPGGHIFMIEPQNSFFSRFIYKNFHHEPFDENGDWRLPAESGVGRLSMANTALPWIVFKRDREKFANLFPNFEVSKLQGFLPFQYLFTGGVSYRQFWPTRLWWIIEFMEWLTKPVYRFVSMVMIIDIVKTK